MDFKKLLILPFLVFSLVVPAQAADQWEKGKPDGTTQYVDEYDDEVQENNEAIDRVLSNFRQNMILSKNSASEIGISSGQVVCSNLAGTIRRFRSETSSNTTDFTDIDSGSEASATTYYVYAVADVDETGVTFSISTDSSAPSGATYYRRLGSFYNDSSSDISIVTNDDIVPIKSYDSGWFSASAGPNSYTKSHNLGTQKLIIGLYSATTSGGANTSLVGQTISTGDSEGGVINSITTTQMTITTGISSLIVNNNFTGSDRASGYLRVVAIALE